MNRTHAIPPSVNGSPDTHNDPLAVLFLGITVIIMTSFDYVWYGPFPLWLILVVAGLFISVTRSSHRRNLQKMLSHMFLWVILPWLFFVIMVTVVDILKGQIEETFSKRTGLNLATLLLMCMVGTWTSRVRPRTTIYLLALIGTLQGVICIAQYYQVEAAWDLPNTLMQAVGARDDITLIPQVHFVDVQRARGTTLLVHKFNTMQGMLTAFLLAVVVLNVQVKNVLKLQPLLLLAATLFTFIGMFLTFSRSTILGVALTMVILLLNTRRFVTIAIIGSSIGLGYLIFQVLQLDAAAQFGRITDFSETRAANASRIEQYPYALQIFANHPLIGNPRGDSAERILLHSVLLRLLVDYGMLGVIAYLLVVFGVVRMLWKGRKRHDDCAQVLALASLCSFLIALLDAWTHSSGFLVRDVNQAGMVGLFLGLLMPHPLVATRRLVGAAQRRQVPLPSSLSMTSSRT